MASDPEEVSRVFINLSGDFELGDGRIGTVVSTPELSELNSFLGVLREAVNSDDAYGKAFRKIAKQFRDKRGAVLEVRTGRVGTDLLTHSFQVSYPEPLSEKELEDFLAQHGWSLDCYHPFEISSLEDPTSTASGQAARLVVDALRNS